MMGVCEEKSDLLKDKLSFSSVFFLFGPAQFFCWSGNIQSCLLVLSYSFLSTDLPADCFVTSLDVGFVQGLPARLRRVSGETVSFPLFLNFLSCFSQLHPSIQLEAKPLYREMGMGKQTPNIMQVLG